MALVHLKGLGVPQDGLIAYKFMQQAADGGYPEAQYSLGILLFDGKHFFNEIPINSDVGLRWLEKAMEQGHSDAAEIIQFLCQDHRDHNIFSEMLRDKMKALLEMPNIALIESKPPTKTFNEKTEDSGVDKRENTEPVEIIISSSSAFFRPAQEPSEQLENNAQSNSWSYWCTIS